MDALESLEALEESVPAVGQLKRDFIENGGSQAEWIDIMNRPGLESWARQWFKAGEPESNKRLDEVVSRYFVPYELIEYAVRTDENKLTGYALASIVEAKTYRNQISVKVKHIHSDDKEFDNWALLHLTELADFHLHICRKKAGACKVNSPSKDLGWFHVSSFRMMTYLEAFAEGYDETHVYGDLRHYTEVCLAEIEEERQAKDVKLVPRRGEEPDEAPVAEVKEKEDRPRPGQGK